MLMRHFTWPIDLWSDPWVVPVVSGLAAVAVVLLVRPFVGCVFTQARRAARLRMSHVARSVLTAIEMEQSPHGVLDLRESKRRNQKLVFLLVLRKGARRKPIEGLVVNRSCKGLGLALPEAVDVGTTLEVRTANAPDITPWIPVTVVHCQPVKKGYWWVGCQFDSQPPWNVLLLFG